MKRLLFTLAATGFCSCLLAQAPETFALLSAQGYNQFKGNDRLREITKLESDNWYTFDTLYSLGGSKSDYTVHKQFIGPYMDQNGQVVHLAPEVAAEFPGGTTALKLFLEDVLGPELAARDAPVQSSIYLRCVIDDQGNVASIEEAQEHLFGNKELINHCIESVKLMPQWTPAYYRGKTVFSVHLLSFSLK
jgi:hypothetical protein